MRRFFILSAAVVTIVLTGVSVQAQSTGFTQRGYPNATDAYQSGMRLYYKTWADLNQAQNQAISNPGDWYRYDIARGQMDLLERNWKDGTFDRQQLINAISDVQQVLKFNNLSAQDRNIVAGDLEQLQDLRINYGR